MICCDAMLLATFNPLVASSNLAGPTKKFVKNQALRAEMPKRFFLFVSSLLLYCYRLE